MRKYWKVMLAALLLIAAAVLRLGVYSAEKTKYEQGVQKTGALIAAQERTIEENRRYAGVREKLPQAEAQIEESRRALYAHFPTELREEDQILYVLYLEQLFGTEIDFSFGEVTPLRSFSDGSALCGLTLTVNYETDYQGFKDMIQYLASDSRVTSIRYCTMQYNAEKNIVSGSLTLLCYLMQSELLEYRAPEISAPDTGKENIFVQDTDAGNISGQEAAS
ncbi:MAG: hypothetical protein IKK00_02505 [Oscillospiraceae bacterium]|nr:hypothetical protein [Oscillospiraceae bacterium]MBR6561704.1 hypothetical protein [Oscillospiraceae bacterium]